MFDRFGEFDSAEELNEAAKGMKEEGDIESLIELAIENGLEKEDAQDYAEDCADVLATPLMAAYGKLKVEETKMIPQEIMEDWLQYIKIKCAEEEKMAIAVRKKGKSLKGAVGALLAWSFKNQKPVDKEIMKSAGVTAGSCTLGIPGMARAKKIISDYYLK